MKNKVTILLLFILISTFCFGQVESEAYDIMLRTLLSHTVNEVGVEDIDYTQDIIFLDARGKEEYQVSHLKNAIWVGFGDFDPNRISHLPEDANIIVYCSVGYRSEKIAEKLEALGYSNVANLYGGIFEWSNQQRPVYKEGVETDSVHAYNKLWGVWLESDKKVYKSSKQ